MIRRTSVSLLVLFLLAAMPAGVSAHATLVLSEPPAGGAVEGTPDRIVATFDQALGPKSSISLRNATGDRVLVGAVDAATGTSIVMEPEALEAGMYEVRWTAESLDGDLVRGSYRITIAPPAQGPSPSPPVNAPTASPRPPPSATAAPSFASSSAGATVSPAAGEPAAAGADVLLPIVSALALLAVLGLFLLGRGRPPARP